MVDHIKTRLYSVASSFQPSQGIVINVGMSEVRKELYNYRIISKKREDGVRIAQAWYYNIPKEYTYGNYRNCFIFSGELLGYSVFQGRTYITLKQKMCRSTSNYTLLKLAINDTINLKALVGEPCIVGGYLFPRPLGSRYIAISGCCEILKINDKIIYKDSHISLL